MPVYHGKKYRLAADKGELSRARRVCGVCLAAAFIGEITLFTVNSQLMRTWYVSVPVMLGLIALAVLTGCAVRFFRTKADIRREDRDRLENSYPASAAFYLLLNSIAVITGCIACAAHPEEYPICVCPAVCAASGWMMFSVRGTLRCTEIAPQKPE